MAPTTKATVEVSTADLRHALAAVHPHHRKGTKEDAKAQHRLRLVFANGYLYVCASNEDSTGLAKIKYREDSRGNLWEPDDGPLVVDMQPRYAKHICTTFSAKAVASDVDQAVVITIDADDQDVTFTDVGGLWSSGVAVTLPFHEGGEAFPDVIEVTGRAFAEAKGEAERARALNVDGRVMRRFEAASIQYGAPLRVRAIGSPEQRAGFLVQAGAAFAGTVASGPEDDGLKTRDKIDMEWLRLLDTRHLVSA